MQRVTRPLSQAIRQYSPVTARPLAYRPANLIRATQAPRHSPILALASHRWNSTTTSEAPTPTPRAFPHKPAPHRDPNEPIYQLTFTCKPCQERSSHTISKQGYHRGTVLITCPGCKNKHLIADHLKIFSDTSLTVEDIMAQKGEDVQRGSITPDGDVEFWSQDAEPVGKE